ncbi:HupE/UreJ family protein [Albimonas sp. CAU 1670]|uniref:HupE/UreJ family protein n=1 Tax=Albimonas sp. CAU 1670 TaxID=3032599 RepID=UPI0023D9C3CA|nr:HupE/UreJ family protein [Albimonas sp. CAU 1670]MDF2231262.1 HupE/UreJ family protein [Albimonas sp. CAU 1670]
MRAARLLASLGLLLSALLPVAAAGHALDPAYLELSELGDGRWRVSLRIPDVAGRPMPLRARLPEGCSGDAPAPGFDGRGWSSAWLALCPEGLTGGEIGVDGLAQTRTDALVRWQPAGAEAHTHRLTPDAPAFVVPTAPGVAGIVASYVSLGVSHILEGIDHLLFVLALVLLVRGRRRLLWTITAFTLAHSLTLAAATLGWLSLPSAPVEAVIALSIVFLAWELTLPPERRDPLAERAPALIAFGFGLVHGLGFAGALGEIGLPPGDIPLALFAFNLGVELGQLLFVGAVLALAWAAATAAPILRARSASLSRAAGYGIGGVAAFWVIERVAAF